MPQKNSTFLTSLKNTQSLFFIGFNLLFFIYFSFQFNANNYPLASELFATQGETVTYYEPLENLATGLGYSWTTSTTRFGDYREVTSTRRVPGIGLIYLPLRLLMSEKNALNAIIIMQWALYVIGWLFLIHELLKRYSPKKDWHIWIIYTLPCVSTFDKVFNQIGLAESLSNFAILFSLGLFLYYLRSTKQAILLLIGFFLAWTTFLRPATGIFFPVFIAFIFLEKFSFSSLHRSLKNASIMTIPLIMGISFWTLRNFEATSKIIMLEDHITESQPAIYPPIRMHIRDVINSTGGRMEPWVEGSFGQYMFRTKKTDLSGEIFAWNQESEALIEELKLMYDRSSTSMDSAEIKQLDNESKIISEFLIESYNNKKPFNYFLVNPICHFVNFFNKKFLSYLPFPPLAEMNLSQKLIKTFETVFHYSLVLLFLMQLFHFSNWKTDSFRALTILMVLFYSTLMSFIFNATEPRYSVSIYPMLLLICCFYFLKRDKLTLSKL